MPELWGLAAGLSQAQQEQDRHAQVMAELSLLPYQQAEAKIKVESDEIGLQTAKMALQRQQLTLQYLQQHASGQATGSKAAGSGIVSQALDGQASATDYLSQQLQYLGDAEQFGGNLTAAADYYHKAAEARKQGAEIQKIGWEQQMKRLDLFSNALSALGPPGQVTQQKWEEQNWAVAQQTGQPTPFMRPDGNGSFTVEPYDPRKVGLVAAMVQDAKEKAQTSLARAETVKAAADARLADERAKILPQTLQVSKDRLVLEEKRLGKQNLQLTLMGQRISREYDTASPQLRNSLQAVALSAALRAQELEQGGMNRKDAIDRAFTERQLAGDYDALPPRTDLATQEPGTTFRNPAAVPKDRSKGWTPTQSSWYSTPKGTLQYRPDLDRASPWFSKERLEERSKVMEAQDNAQVRSGR